MVRWRTLDVVFMRNAHIDKDPPNGGQQGGGRETGLHSPHSSELSPQECTPTHNLREVKVTEAEAVAGGHVVQAMNELKEGLGNHPEKVLVRRLGNDLYMVQYWEPGDKDPNGFQISVEEDRGALYSS